MGIKKFLLAALSCAAALTVPLSACGGGQEEGGLTFTEATALGGRRFYVASGTVEAEDGVYHIPGSHEGLPVSQVEDITFVGNGTVLILGEGIEYIESGILGDNRHITSLVLPTTVEEIYSYAFSGTALEYVNFSAGLWNIGQEAFRGTPLKSVCIPSNVGSVGGMAFYESSIQSAIVEAQSVGRAAFACCPDLVHVSLGDDTIRVYDRAFRADHSLVSVNLNDVQEIWHDAFNDCDALERITIPAAADFVSSTAFCGCASLEEIVFEKTSDWFLCKRDENFDYVPVAAADLSDSAANVELLGGELEDYVYRRIPGYEI